ncbi:hypothetical protein FWF48_02320 [Candidatus Saccharibacteria bacterium]|nr:hypothetical protein [Candidatus Saccharibacteria bacterium]
MALTLLPEIPTPHLVAVPILTTEIPELGKTVLDTLNQQASLRDKLRDTKDLDYIDPNYAKAPRALMPEDVGREITFLGAVYDENNQMVVNEHGQVISTLTEDSWSTKRKIGLELAKRLSKASGDDIRVMDIEAWNLLATAALQQDNMAAFANLAATECVGTKAFKTGGRLLCAVGDVGVDVRWVGSCLDYDYSYSRYAVRLLLVGSKKA